MSHFTGEDLIFYKENTEGPIMSGGYLIDSIMLKNSIPPMTTYNYNHGGGGSSDSDKVSSIFQHLAVPAGLFYTTERSPKMDACEFQSTEALSDDIHDRLFALVEITGKKPKNNTKKHKTKLNKNKHSHKNK
jgi:hypothetical protein